MKQTLITLALASCCAFAGTAGAALTKEEHKAQKDRIEADYKAAKERCKPMKDNAADICKVEAKGNHKVAKAELDNQTQSSPRNAEKLKLAKAEAAYELAKEKCDDLNGNAKDVCKKDAKASYVTAKGDAKVGKAQADKANVTAERKDASDDKADAKYAAAKERCDAMSGDAKDKCVNDAKKKFGKM